MTKTVCRQVGVPVLLFAAFYAAGLLGTCCESYHNNMLMSCAVFTAAFSTIVASGAKLYHAIFN